LVSTFDDGRKYQPRQRGQHFSISDFDSLIGGAGPDSAR